LQILWTQCKRLLLKIVSDFKTSKFAINNGIQAAGRISRFKFATATADGLLLLPV